MDRPKDIYDAILDAPVIQFGESTYVSVKDLMDIIIDFEDTHRGRWIEFRKGIMNCSVCRKPSPCPNATKNDILKSYAFCRHCGSKMVDAELLDDRTITRYG